MRYLIAMVLFATALPGQFIGKHFGTHCGRELPQVGPGEPFGGRPSIACFGSASIGDGFSAAVFAETKELPGARYILGFSLVQKTRPLLGCELLLGDPLWLFDAKPDETGFAIFRLQLPELPKLVGAKVHVQGAALHKDKLYLTRGVTVTIQPKAMFAALTPKAAAEMLGTRGTTRR